MKKTKIHMAVLSLSLASILGFSTVAEAKQTTYMIRKGDTLYSIAKKHGTTVEALKEINRITSNIIPVGRTLIIAKTVIVKKGDTLYKIAKTYGMTVEELKKLNQLKTTKIFPNQKLYVNSTSSPITSYNPDKVTLQAKLPKDFELVAEEPRRFILQHKKDGSSFVRIEILAPNTDLLKIKLNSIEYLKPIGKAIEINDPFVHPFYKNSHFYLHASNMKLSQNIVVKTIDGKLMRFTLHFTNNEESEGISPVLVNTLRTMKAK
ncbi:LysM peptidoglycan-binding domain-containing protein [Peribacillus alkalitolerans]|uniref:LysM peptidoglycan-binding domain-containing protein n=1 Tax=Peribacillus alkalitolerans TaxID=1550385 RepID=UPI00196824A6|nr:LysM peptidoglycan-binding domain-containing protein [Peribacillus alkalitolerans]